jgi:hypothetical protein
MKAAAPKRKRARRPKANRSQNENSGMSSSSGVSASYSTRIQTKLPRIKRDAQGFRVAHRELVVASVLGNVGFSVKNTLQLNPGLAATFPWLAPQAQQWEQYRCHKLIVQYVPIVATSEAGDILISPDYDAADPPPTTEAQASDNKDACADSCWKRMDVVLDVKAMMGLGPRKYVRPCSIAGDIKTFDLGKLFICTVNANPDATPFGKIYLDYDFEFFCPQNSPNPDTLPQSTSLFKQGASVTTLATGVGSALNFAAAGIFDPLNIGTPTVGVWTPPAGVYLVKIQCVFKDTSNEAFAVTLQVFKNGASADAGAITSFNYVPGVANNLTGASLEWVLPMNGTDTLQFQGTATGAAGTLTVIEQIAIFSLA